MANNKGLSRPPEGVMAGESIPRENEQEDLVRAKVDEVMGVLKGRGEPYISMPEDELRERARQILLKNSGNR